MKIIKWLLISLFVALCAAAIFIWFMLSRLEEKEITRDVFMLSGLGGNVTVLKTGEGAVVIDSMIMKFQGNRIIRKAMEAAGEEKIAMLINTHYHDDHTGGNPAFLNNVRIVASAKTAQYLQRCNEHLKPGAAGFPTELIEESAEFKIGNKTIALSQPGAGHTGGDLVVRFVEDDVLVLGDLFFNKLYPNIDLEAGGSVQQWPATLEKVLREPAKHYLPGHGKKGTIDDLKLFQNYLSDLAGKSRDAVARGVSFDDLRKDAGFGSHPEFHSHFLFLTDEFVAKRTWQEATNDYKANSCPTPFGELWK